MPRRQDRIFFDDNDAEALFDAGITRLESLGGTKLEIPYATFDEAQKLLYEAPFLAERSVSLEGMIAGRKEDLHPVTRGILETADAWTARDHYRAFHRLAELKRDARRLLAGIDVFVVPTTPTIYRVAEVEADPVRLNARLGTYTNFVNLMGYCGVAVPMGFRRDGLPLD